MQGEQQSQAFGENIFKFSLFWAKAVIINPVCFTHTPCFLVPWFSTLAAQWNPLGNLKSY